MSDAQEGGSGWRPRGSGRPWKRGQSSGRGRGESGGRGHPRGRSQWRGGRWNKPWRGRAGASVSSRGGASNVERNLPDNSFLMPPPTPRSPSRPAARASTYSESDKVHTMTPASINVPFRAWKLYLPTEEYSEQSTWVKKLRLMIQVLAAPTAGSSPETMATEQVKELYTKRFFVVDLKRLSEDPRIESGWPDLAQDLDEHSEVVAGVFALAKHQLVLEALNEHKRSGSNSAAESFASLSALSELSRFPIVRARLVNVEPITSIRSLKAKYFGRFVTVQGTVIRISSVRPMCIWMAFECDLCLCVQSVYQPYGKFVQPQACPSAGCRGKARFTPLLSHQQTVTVDWQSLRLQEVTHHESGRVPRTIDIELSRDLCDSAAPGDVVFVSGVVRIRTVTESRLGAEEPMSVLHIHALSVVQCNGGNNGRAAGASLGIEFSPADYMLVQEIHAIGPLIFKLLVHSLCPSIYGHELVKAGLILCLFGGTSRNISEKVQVPIRSDPHILIVGDPGLGKSQMLTSCASVAPRGVFVSGNTTTCAGLTVTLSKEAAGEYTIDAGALVLADQGVCCIDEFDKMTSQHQALLETMEQQSVCIAKSGVVCTLPARASVLAVANPSGGHYNKAKTVSENLKLGSPLLSRFDLVFVLIDRPDEEMDGLLSDHIMRLHSGDKAKAKEKQSQQHGLGRVASTPVGSTSSLTFNDGSFLAGAESLAGRLRRRADEDIQAVPHHYMRKYIAYARRYVAPKLTQEAGKVLQEFYLELREQRQTRDSTPITLRQLESLIRLTEARAKLELREDATEQDAIDVVDIMRASMMDTMADETGKLDFSRSLNGSGTSTRGAARKFIIALQRQAQALERDTFSVEELKQILNATGAKVISFYDFLTTLNTQGFLLKKSSTLYKLLSVDY